jgi:zinc protease
MMKKPFCFILLIAIVIDIAITGEIPARDVYTREVLPNGMTIIIKSNPDSKVFAVSILAKGRALLEANDKAGITEFVNRMMLKGTANYTSEELARALDNHGVRLTLYDNPFIPYDDRYTSRDFAFIKMETIDEYARGSMGLLAEIMSRPAFPLDKIEEVRSEIMGVLGMNSGSTYKTARNLFYAELFSGLSYAKPILGTMRTIGSITFEDLVEHHKKMYAPENIILAVVTNIPAEVCLEMVKEDFGYMEKSGYSYPEYPQVNPIKSVVKTHQQMDKDQIYIYLGNITPGIQDPSYPAMIIAGSALSTRMGLELREKQGLAYSVGAGLSAYPGFGVFYSAMGTGYMNRQKAINGILSEIGQIRQDGISEEERTNTINNLWGSMLTRNLSRANQAYYMAAYEFLGVGYQYWDTFIDELRGVTANEVRLAAERYFSDSNYVLATVGKK